ncbi:MAG: beta-ketoacyl synthase [Bacteroidota bacterium]|nr:beta-ketoacyl synthase [Bacteroidota bacterium]
METGIKSVSGRSLSAEPVCAAVINDDKITSEFDKLNIKDQYTRLEKLFILSIADTLKQAPAVKANSSKTLIILSSTKGNIDLLGSANNNGFDKKRLTLWETGNVITKHFGNPNKALIVSNACISGVLAMIIGKRLLEQGVYENIIVSGGDILTHFVVSGFQSFKAVSNEVCKPYDASRDGISLGEACGTVILTNNSALRSPDSILIKGGASSNDANHISGPSRTGDGLSLAIEKTLHEANLKPSEIDFISGHGTATPYNDEMESQALTASELQNVPMNSLKSYFGHTLGAAGIIESIAGIHSIKNNTLIGTYNFKELGVTKPINIIKETKTQKLNNCLKTAAGFGGCNAAILFSKN